MNRADAKMWEEALQPDRRPGVYKSECSKRLQGFVLNSPAMAEKRSRGPHIKKVAESLRTCPNGGRSSAAVWATIFLYW